MASGKRDFAKHRSWQWESGDGVSVKFLTASWITGLAWVTQYREVHVRPVAARHGAAEFLTSTQEPVQLAVVGSSDADKVARMVGPLTPHFGHAGRSVLVVDSVPWGGVIRIGEPFGS